jgi:hypothetical protein
MAKMIKKAQNGAKTADSTAYFNKEKESRFKEAREAGKLGFRKSADDEMKKGMAAGENAMRQKRKGMPGYDKNGYPIKKKMQTGGSTKKSVPMSVAKKKIDSLNYDANINRAAAMQRTVTDKKGYDDISQKLMKNARKSDSISQNWQRGVDKANLKGKAKKAGTTAKKSTSSMKTGGKVANKK